MTLVVPQFHYQYGLRSRKTLLSVTVVLCIFWTFSFDVAQVLLNELLDPETKVQRVRSYGLSILHYLLSVDVVFCVSSELCPLGTALQ